MALIICPECSRQVSEHAPHCPHCGFPIAGNPLSTRPATAEDEVVLQRRRSTTSAQGTTATYSAPDPAPYNTSSNTNGEPEEKGKRRSGFQTFMLVFFGVLIALGIVMFITCPSDGDHRREVRQLGEKAVKMYAAKQNNALVTGMAFAFGDDLVDMVISKLLEVDNYGVVSIGRLQNPKHPEKAQVVSVGVFGHVFTASPEELAEGISGKLQGIKDEVVEDAKEEVKTKVDEAIEEAKESARKKAEEIANEIKEEAENKAKEIVDEVVEQTTNEDLFENNKEDDKKNNRNVEKP